MKEKLTIVGPINTSDNSSKVSTKNNLDAIFIMAKYNREFKESILIDKEKAITEAGFILTKSENLVINNIDTNKLKKIIDFFKIPGITKKSLSNWRSAAAIVLLVSSLAMTTESCRVLKHRHSKGATLLEHVPEKKINTKTIAPNNNKA